MNYFFLIAFGLACMALIVILHQPTGRIIAAVLAAVLFVLAAVTALVGADLTGPV